MKSKAKRAPAGRGRLFWKVLRGGREIGNFHTLCAGGVRVNLWTTDAIEAGKRAKAARAAIVAGSPAPNFRKLAEGAVASADSVAALGRRPEPLRLLAPVAAAPAPPPPPEPDVIEPERIEPQPAGGGDWAADVGASAGAAAPAGDGGAPPPASHLRFQDIPGLEGALITASKVLVATQVRGQAAALRWIGDLEAGQVGPAPAAEPQTTEELGELLKKAGKPWGEDDPREPGRQIWEGFLRRVMPDDLPIPDYLLAPLVVAVFTLPLQLAGAKPIERTAAPPDESADGAPAAERPAA